MTTRKTAILAERGSKRVPQMDTGGKGETVTAVACCSATGVFDLVACCSATGVFDLVACCSATGVFNPVACCSATGVFDLVACCSATEVFDRVSLVTLVFRLELDELLSFN